MPLVPVEIRGIELAAKRDVTHLGLLRRQQRFERNFEDFFDLARLQHVVDALVDDADERRDQKSAVGDEVIEPSDQLDVLGRDADFLMRLAKRCRFKRLVRFGAAAGKCDLPAVRGEIR